MDKSDNKTSLVFVYNADSGLFNTLTDIAHKMFLPDTYSCNLCKITHNNFNIKRKWKDFTEHFDVDFEFLHRDEFLSQYAMQDALLPCIFIKENNALSEWISADDINNCKSVEQLADLIRDRNPGVKR